MAVTLATPLSHITLAPGSAMTVSGLSWQHYQLLLLELGSQRPTRLAYSAGTLEVRMPSQLHEIVNRLLSKIIYALAEELQLNIVDMGSTTWNRADLDKGIEPDSSFYIQHADRIQGLNPAIPENLPPDLAVEVDIASASDKKLGIYSSLGVPELWLYRKGQVQLLGLGDAGYRERATSLAFPQLTTEQLNAWLTLRETAGDLMVIKAVREFCRSCDQ